MLRLMVRLLPVIVCLSVFAVFVTVLSLVGQSDLSQPPQNVEHQVATGQSPANPLPPAAPAPDDHIFLPLIANMELNSSDEYPPSRNDGVNAAAHAGNSAEDPPAASRHTFVTDQALYLDDYYGRSELPGGRISFPITLTAPVISQDRAHSDGSIKSDEDYRALLNIHTIPEYVFLELHVWDVDDDVSLGFCPEIDYVFINGHRLEHESGFPPFSLHGGNGKWATWSISFKSDLLRFAVTQRVDGQLPVPAVNEISIEVNAECEEEDWQVEVDWGALYLGPSLAHPLLFVHGWTGDNLTFKAFQEFADYAGYSVSIPANYGDGIEDLTTTTALLSTAISQTLTEFNAEKVNIFGHSRGGLFARHLLRTLPDLAPSINAVVTLGTAHHGENAVTPLAGFRCWWEFGNDADKRADCFDAADALTEEAMVEFNYAGCQAVRFPLTLPPLFSISGDHAAALNTAPHPSAALVAEFAGQNHMLAPDALIQIERVDNEWMILGEPMYLIGRGTFGLNVYTVASVELPEYPTVIHWYGCTPRSGPWEMTRTKHTLVGALGDVSPKTATFPWRADAAPFPHAANVDMKDVKR